MASSHARPRGRKRPRSRFVPPHVIAHRESIRRLKAARKAGVGEPQVQLGFGLEPDGPPRR